MYCIARLCPFVFPPCAPPRLPFLPSVLTCGVPCPCGPPLGPPLTLPVWVPTIAFDLRQIYGKVPAPHTPPFPPPPSVLLPSLAISRYTWTLWGTTCRRTRKEGESNRRCRARTSNTKFRGEGHILIKMELYNPHLRFINGSFAWFWPSSRGSKNAATPLLFPC